MSEKEPLRITLEDLGEAEPAAVPERDHGALRDGAAQAGQKVAGAVKGSASRVVHKIADTTTDVTGRSAEAMRDKVGEAIQAQSKATADAIEARLREMDWKQEAQKGAEGGLRRLSQWLESMAEQLARKSEAEPTESDTTKPKE